MTVVMRRLCFAEVMVLGLLFWMVMMSRNGRFPRTATAFFTSNSFRHGPSWLYPKPPVLQQPPHYDDSSCLFASTPTTTAASTTSTDSTTTTSSSSSITSPTLAAQAVLQAWKDDADYRALYNDNNDNDHNNHNSLNIPPGLYSLIRAIKESQTPLGLGNGVPFVLRHDELPTSTTSTSSFSNLFTLQDLEEAVAQDFLDAARGSTNHRKGWKVRP